MKVQIRDEEALASLTSAHLRTYLETQGWGNPRPWGQWGTIFSKEQGGKLWEITILLRDDGFGYTKFMAQIVATLAEAEDRSQLDVFYDLANAKVSAQFQDSHKGVDKMTNVWCVRGEAGTFADEFVNGGYAGIGWLRNKNLTKATGKGEIRRLYKDDNPQDKDGRVNTNVGQITRFMLEVKIGDYILTPTSNSALLRYGRVTSEPYYENPPKDKCYFPHRRRVQWAPVPFNRNDLSEPFQKALKHTQLTVFRIKHSEEFLNIFSLPGTT